MDEDTAIELPIDGVLDLHAFRPQDIKTPLPDYLTACRERGILHGKGTGALRRTVHALLSRLPEVIAFRLVGKDAGGWGATLVTLAPALKGQDKP